MSKILNINDGIKINKDNVDFGSLAMIRTVVGTTGGVSDASVTFTLNSTGYNGFALLSTAGASNTGNLYGVFVRNGIIHTVNKIIDNDSFVAVSFTDTQLTIKLGSWGSAVLIDFGNNSWS